MLAQRFFWICTAPKTEYCPPPFLWLRLHSKILSRIWNGPTGILHISSCGGSTTSVETPILDCISCMQWGSICIIISAFWVLICLFCETMKLQRLLYEQECYFVCVNILENKCRITVNLQELRTYMPVLTIYTDKTFAGLRSRSASVFWSNLCRHFYLFKLLCPILYSSYFVFNKCLCCLICSFNKFFLAVTFSNSSKLRRWCRKCQLWRQGVRNAL